MAYFALPLAEEKKKRKDFVVITSVWCIIDMGICILVHKSIGKFWQKTGDIFKMRSINLLYNSEVRVETKAEWDYYSSFLYYYF